MERERKNPKVGVSESEAIEYKWCEKKLKGVW